MAVWALMRKGLDTADDLELISPASTRYESHRMRVQRTVFTRLTHQTHLDLVSYLDSRGQLVYITMFTIPEAHTWRALAQLRDMNITHASLFPDLDGAALEANWWPQVRNMMVREERERARKDATSTGAEGP